MKLPLDDIVVLDIGTLTPGKFCTSFIARLVPIQIRWRGVEMRLVIEGSGAPAGRSDLALLKAVVRARQQSEDLLTGRAQSVAEIAERTGVGARYVRRFAEAGVASSTDCRREPATKIYPHDRQQPRMGDQR